LLTTGACHPAVYIYGEKMIQKSWKNNLSVTRYLMDICLLVGFILLCLPNITGILLHEWLSLLFIIPFVIHLLLHWDWIISLPKQLISNFKAFKGQARFNLLWDLIFYFAMLIVILSGFLISEAILPQFGIQLTIQPFWAEIHDVFSNLLMPMLGIHLAMHWKWIKSLSVKIFSKK
jgi:hypothetical protein